MFDQMLKAASASVLLNTTVTSLERKNGKYNVQVLSPKGSPAVDAITNKAFDSVVLATPFQFSGIEMQKDLLKHIPDEIPYVTLHVTLFTSPLKLSGAHFNLKEGTEVPTTILTTLSPEEDTGNRHKIVGKSGFFSISTLRVITNPKTLGKEYIYKIFSPEKVTEEFLSSLFGIQRKLCDLVLDFTC
jgi:prenylcysteine oxidase / farnesylcysteine lyase